MKAAEGRRAGHGRRWLRPLAAAWPAAAVALAVLWPAVLGAAPLSSAAPPTTVPARLVGQVPLYSQLASLPVTIGGQRYVTRWTSCGPVTLAMVLNYGRLGPRPQAVVQYAAAAGLYLPGDPEKVFTSPADLARIATHYGLPTWGNVTAGEAAAGVLLREKLARDLPVIIDGTVAMRAGRGTSAHFVVVVAYDGADVTVNDPYTGGSGGSVRRIAMRDFYWAWQHNSDAPRHDGGGWWMTVSPK
jgi:predicted double-glycine peptidase